MRDEIVASSGKRPTDTGPRSPEREDYFDRPTTVQSVKRYGWIVGATLVGLAAVALAVLALDRGSLPDPVGYPDYDIGARVEVYGSNSDRDLHLHILDADAAGSVGAVLFFHGARGNPGQFEGQALAVQDAGMTAILVEYTTFAEGAGTADTIEQGRSVVQWVRSHASELGIDPHRIAIAGASAGGRIAVGTMEPGTNGEIRASADALILFNPAITAGYSGSALPPPPTIVFHGEDDRQVPVGTARSFCTSIAATCAIETYPGGGHGFFNTEPEYAATLASTIDFLRGLGWDRSGGT